jgi:uncharacterized protein YuzE
MLALSLNKHLYRDPANVLPGACIGVDTVKVTYDPEADAAYIQVAPESESLTVARTSPCLVDDTAGQVFVDWSGDGRLIGIELLDAGRRMPATMSTTPSRWFAAALLFCGGASRRGGIRRRALREAGVLISAADETEANRKASAHCDRKADSYRNESGGRVVWQCRRVLTVTPLYDAELDDGVEV